MISRAEWLRKYELYEGCRSKDCDFNCKECEFQDVGFICNSDLIDEAAEIFKMQIMLDGTTHATPL